MKTRKFIMTGLLLLIAALGFVSCKKDKTESPFKSSAAGINTKGLDYYIKIAETLQSKQQPAQAEWDSLFATPFYKLYFGAGVTTPEAQKNEMSLVYKEQTLTSEQQKQYAHHLDYKNNLSKLKSYSASVKDGSVRTELKKYLYPYLPARLQKDELIPTIYYTYYFAEEANGLPDMILQDALLAYKADSYAKGVLSAHEAFHSVTTASLTKRLKISLTDAANPQSVLVNTLSGIAQEGVADLIDKDILTNANSPVSSQFQALMVNEDQLSRNYISRINAALIKYNRNEPLDNQQPVSGFAGHQPGRFMGKVIQQAGLIEELKVDVENPFLFIYTYNKAASQSNGMYPVLSAEAINFLKAAEQQMIKPL
ncbi:MAG TPA: DUF5700 domain-containing putative Zn-dependent protease [Pedobacter sp.]